MAGDRRQLLAQADRASERGEMALAVQCYRRLLADTPNDLTLMQRLADALARAGNHGEARQVFRQLADAYWRGGLRARALAVLRRAARLGQPDSETLAALGERLLDQGLVADAREPLLEAARIAEANENGQGAQALYERVARLHVRDAVSREGLVRVADRGGTPRDRALARVALASVRLANGELAPGFALLRDALRADPQFSVLEGHATIESAAAGLSPEKVPETFEQLDADATAAWTVLRAGLCATLGEPAADCTGAVRAIGESRVHPRVRVAAGALLSRLGDTRGAAATLVGLGADLDQDTGLAGPLAEALATVTAADPADRDAAELLARANAISRTTAATERTGTVESPADAVPALSPDEPLPPAALAKVLEADALLRSGLYEGARAAFAAIPPEALSHPSVLDLRERLDPGGFRRGGRPTPGASKVADEDFVIVEEEPETRTLPPRPAYPSGPPTAGDSGEKAASEAAPPVLTSVDPADAESAYQVAVGMVEMGLGDQAIPLLRQVLGDRTRQIDAVLLLAKIRIARGEQELGYCEALAVRQEVGVVGPDVAAELSAALAELALLTGRSREAQFFVEQLSRIKPSHPALPALRDGVAPPKS